MIVEEQQEFFKFWLGNLQRFIIDKNKFLDYAFNIFSHIIKIFYKAGKCMKYIKSFMEIKLKEIK